MRRRLPGDTQQQRPTGNASWLHQTSASVGAGTVAGYGGSLVHFRSRNRVTEQLSGDSLPLIKCTVDGCDAARSLNASNRISVNLRGNSGATSPVLRGPQSSRVFCPARFSNGTHELLKNCIFLHLKALSAPGQGDEAAKRRYHFGAEP